MTVFPELQHELVQAARRHHGRAARIWRGARPVLVAVACTAIAAALVVLAGRDAPLDERPAPATPAPGAIEHAYGVLQRPPTAADTLPDPRAFERDFLLKGEAVDPARVRLAAEDGSFRVFLVAAPLDGRPALCTVIVAGDTAHRGACAVPGKPISAGPETPTLNGAGVQGFMYRADDGQPGALVLVTADGIDHVTLTFPGGRRQPLAVQDNVAIHTPLTRAPTGVEWSTPDGAEHSAPLRP
jgi:hypothetical protein